MNETANKSYMKGFVPFAIVAAVLSLCGGFTAAVPSNVVAAWGAPAINTTWITLAYSLGAAAMAPIMGKLGDVLGRRRTILLGTLLFGAGQLLIALCPDGSIAWMLVSRFIVGCGAATMAPVVMAYIMTEFPPEKIGYGFTLYMLLSCGMVIFGPTLGGIVIQKTSWRAVMYICVAFCALTFLCCLLMVKKTDQAKKSMSGFDFVGAIFVLIFFSMFLCIPTFGQASGWTASPTLLCLGAGVIALIVLIAVEKKAASPILNGKFMARKQFILPVIVLFLSQGLLQSCMTNTIMFCIYTTGDRTLSGIATSVMYIGMALGTIVLGPQADKKEPRSVAAIALVFVAIGAALQLLYSASTSLVLMCAALFFIGLGLGGNGTIFLKVVLSGLDPRAAGSGSGTYNVFRDMSTPFGVALFVPMFSSRVDTATLFNKASTPEQLGAAVQGCVSAIHSTAVMQIISVVIGIAVCLMLPKIYADKKA
jgi:MFS family permease